MMDTLIHLDGGCLLWIQENLRHALWDPFWIGITSLGDKGWSWLALALLLLCFPRTRKAGILALSAMALCALVTNVCLKNLVARPRPYTQVPGLTSLLPPQSDWSFPSGHTTASFACAGVYLQTLPKRYGTAALILAALIAFSRLYVGVHYPTDVLAGLAIGLIGSRIVCSAARRDMRKTDKT